MAASVNRGGTTVGGRSEGYWGTICGRKAEISSEAKKPQTEHTLERKKVLHRLQKLEEDVNVVGSADGRQNPVKLAL